MTETIEVTETATSSGPAKYSNLLRVAGIGLNTPRTLLLEQTTDHKVVQRFVEQAAVDTRFIVRSAYSAEDGTGQSYAGHFWSSAAVTRAELPATITQAWTENLRISTELAVNGQVYLIVQEYIEHDIGGVLFAPWSFYPDYACVEYSSGGVQDVVAGAAETAIIALGAGVSGVSDISGAESPLPLAKDVGFLLSELQVMCRALQQEFDFAIDCEWAWSTQEQRLVILQVRPQTHAIGPVLALPEPVADSLPAGDWQYTALSESLGRLSPLSFSLLQQLYQDLLPVLRHLGCVAAEADFLCRMPDGTVLVDEQREQQFYALTRFGGFWRGFRAEPLRQQTVKRFAGYDATAAFDYQALSQTFSSWLVSNLLSEGAGRAQQNAPHAYELSWYQPYASLSPEQGDNGWVALNVWGKQVFMCELGKLKRELAPHSQRAFCNWRDYQAGDFTAAESAQQQTVAAAMYDYAAVGQGDAGNTGDAGTLSLAANQVVIAPVLVVPQPAQYYGQLPDGCILIAPYFDNRWVADIRRLQGIVVQRGGHLSHSVIVAREVGVPYCVLPGLELAGFESGMTLTLDPVKKTVG